MSYIIANILAALLRGLLGLRYRVTITGLDAVRDRGTKGLLFLPNHPSALEPFLMRFILQRGFAPHVLMDRDNADRPVVRNFARLFGIIPIPDPTKHGRRSKPAVEAAIAACIGKMRQGENLQYYAAGRLYRSRFEDLGGNSGLERLLPQIPPDTRIILVRTRGLWGSRFSYAHTGRFPEIGTHLLGGLRALLLQGVFFAPRRAVSIEFVEPSDFPRSADRTVLNRYLEAFYNQDACANTVVPLYHWENEGTHILSDPMRPDLSAALAEVPDVVRNRVACQLAAQAIVKPPPPITDQTLLARELGLDSLALVDLGVWVEAEFGVTPGDLSNWVTVGDVMLAACATAVDTAPRPAPPMKA